MKNQDRLTLVLSILLPLMLATWSAAQTKPTTVVNAKGTVEPTEMTQIVAPVTGIIQTFGRDPRNKSKPLDYGSVVKRGDVLLILDDSPYRAALSGAHTDLKVAAAALALSSAKVRQAENMIEQLKKPAADGTTDSAATANAQKTLDVLHAEVVLNESIVEQRKEAVKRAEQDLQQCSIVSPVDGEIIDLTCTVGQPVGPTAGKLSLILIGNVERFQVWAEVSETDVRKVAKGQSVQFTVDACPNVSFSGQVATVRLNAAKFKDRGVIYTVVIDTDPNDTKLLPYLTANVTIDVTHH